MYTLTETEIANIELEEQFEPCCSVPLIDLGYEVYEDEYWVCDECAQD